MPERKVLMSRVAAKGVVIGLVVAIPFIAAALIFTLSMALVPEGYAVDMALLSACLGVGSLAALGHSADSEPPAGRRRVVHIAAPVLWALALAALLIFVCRLVFVLAGGV